MATRQQQLPADFLEDWNDLKKTNAVFQVEVNSKLETINVSLEKVVHFIDGNGSPGAKVRINQLENQVKELCGDLQKEQDERKAEEKDRKSHERKIQYMFYAAMIGLIVNLVLPYLQKGVG